VDLTLNEEQTAVRDAIRDVLRERQPSERVRAVMAGDAGVDVDLWRAAGALGWFGLALAEAAGGAGYCVPEAMLLFTELGRALTPGPWLGTVLAAQALAGSPSHRVTLESLLVGGHRVAVVEDPFDRLGSGPRLDGMVQLVLDGGAADALLVLGTSVVRLVRTDAVGVTAATSHGIDPTRRPATVTFDGVAADVLSGDAGALRLVATVLVAAEAAGVAERTLEMSVEYAKVREQFGKPIGTFQAIKHRCADMAVRAEVARSHVTYAAVALQDGEADAPFHVHVAKTLAVDAALQNATDNIQNHGGMGYTWESDAHLYLKRARALEHCFGTRTAHLDALVASWRTAS
jgi:alkylation response protein AidB-like acyl-CoA dehydrogenase